MVTVQMILIKVLEVPMVRIFSGAGTGANAGTGGGNRREGGF